ncbi:hypothetical protein F4861DRAFT_532378 [Xylaria intraflava]|nr:hypothetical protein F4861DRAFT_532378 [Xylaria intraflava]
MALFRSASGPGGLSINTSSANMFGPTTGQAPAPTSTATGGLFASTAQTAQTANTSTPKPGGLFGSTINTTSLPQQGTTSLFGSASATPASSQPQQPQPQTGGLFGSASQSQPQPAAQSTPSLFGAAPQSQAQPQQAQTTAGLFGSTTNAGAQPATTATSGGLGLFGASQPASNAPGSTVLGQSTQQRPGLFGSLGQQTQSQPVSLAHGGGGGGGGLGFGLTMGQSNSQPTVPGVRIDLTNLKGTTRFNDLQENLQKMLEQADGFIAEQIRRKEEVDSFMSGHREMLESIPEDVKFVSRKCDGARNSLESAAQSIEAARLSVNQDADSARLSFRAVDNLKLPQQYHTSGFWSPRQQASGNANAETDGQDLVGFFSKTADEMADQVRKYEKNLTDIELHMHGVSDNLVEQLQRVMATKNGAPSATDERIQELVVVLRDFEQGILKVASDVGGAKEGMTRLQVGDFMSHEREINGVY